AIKETGFTVTVLQIRCLKCAKWTEITSTDDPGTFGMVRIGYNLHYYLRCAGATGYP
ncbi:hypothetical protein QBC46DRAFT_217947, partial [Diplogelasinospora grovesii]